MDVLRHHENSLDDGYRLSCQYAEYGSVEDQEAQQKDVDQLSADYRESKRRGLPIRVLDDNADGFVYNDLACHRCKRKDCPRNPKVKAEMPDKQRREMKWLHRAGSGRL